GLLELLGVPYTGASAAALAVCKDKALAKKILSFHKIKTPRFVVSPRIRPLKQVTQVGFPAFVKPLSTEGSEGIAQAARVENEAAALERIRFVHESVKSDALVEEFIEGRELYAGVIGNERLQSLPLVELFVAGEPLGDEAAPQGAPKFFTYRAKWDAAYRKKWRIKAGPPKDLPPDVEKRIGEIARRVYHSLGVTGYGRVDLRLTPAGEIYVIEVNPNPGLAQSDEFAKAAARADIPYDSLIARIVQLAER
ncbi:MAG TPA: ATP-grasp domain-containing protein, partial [bacterium]|nr:ATP-grasp domain-containing protein [bacterium]